MALSLPLLPFFWLTPDWAGHIELRSLGLLGAVSQYWTTQALAHAPAAAVSPFNYTALVWGSLIGFVVWDEVPTVPIVLGAAIVTIASLYLVRHEAFRRAALPTTRPTGAARQSAPKPGVEDCA